MFNTLIKTKALEPTIYHKLITFFTKKGKKEHVIIQLTSVLFSLQRKSKFSYPRVLWQIFKKLNTVFELRVVKRKGRVFNVPAQIAYARQVYLTTNWLYKSITASKEKISLKHKLEKEFTTLLRTNQSAAQKLKQKNAQLVCSNKSLVHFRW